MTKTFKYTFTHFVKDENGEWKAEEITLTKKVTDRMEERNGWKKVYAANYFNNVLREQYGRKRAEAFARNIEEI